MDVTTAEHYMRRTIRLARRAIGRTSPNPMVGAVIVRAGEILAEGYHRRAGQDHAEVDALRKVAFRAKNADLYVNLEPCNHRGRTGPCTEAILDSGIRRVFIGMVDPNPSVSGAGIQRLRQGGIEVVVGILEAECRRLNEAFIKYVRTAMPFVVLKLAQTLDGRIGAASGHSQWITGEQARRLVHRLRSVSDAVMVGVGTVIHDDPWLTTRLARGRDPTRVVVDSNLRLSPSARLLRSSRSAPAIVATTVPPGGDREGALVAAGAQVIRTAVKNGRVDLRELLFHLGRRDITLVLVEGGAQLATSLIKESLVDKVYVFLAPRLLGGDAIASFGSMGFTRVTDSISFSEPRWRRVGADMLFEGYLPCSQASSRT